MNRKGPGLFLDFYKKERTGVIVLTILAILIAIIPRWIMAEKEPVKLTILSDSAIISAPANYTTNKDSFRKPGFYQRWKKELISLGVPESRIGLIYSRIQKEQYIDKDEWIRLTGVSPEKLVTPHPPHNKDFNLKTVNPIELNSADSATLLKLPGIGAKYAARIIKFRIATGGFYSPRQLFDIWYIDSNIIKPAMSFLYANERNIKKLEVSEDNKNRLIAHPYFNKRDVEAILRFKAQHGAISARNILEHPAIDETTKTHMLHYLLLDDEN